MSDLDGALDRLAEAAEQARETSAAITRRGSGLTSTEHAEEAKDQMVAAAAAAREQHAQVAAAHKEARDEIDRVLRATQAELEAQMRAKMGELAPLLEQAKQLQEGIWSVNLYLGTQEEVVTLREGRHAPADTPISMRQAVLGMDEETVAITDPTSEPFDFRNLDLFDAWIVKPSHLAQVLPEEKGIVVLRPTATPVDYGDPALNDAYHEANMRSYWLIRNGDAVYRMSTDFEVGDTLIPLSAEFTALFRERVRENGEYVYRDIEPGTPAWGRAEKGQDQKRRHYMRVALILQGLLDRTEVLKPLPGAVSVLHQSAYDDGLVNIITDADTSKMLTTKREPYYEWIKRLNRELRPGMRIIGSFGGEQWRASLNRDWDGRLTRGHARLYPDTAEVPSSLVLHTIEDRRPFEGQTGLVIRYRRGQVYDPDLWRPAEDKPGWGYRGGRREAKRRASCVIVPSDTYVIPFDLVTEAEMQEYLDARTERHAYKDSFPLLQAAIRVKRAEKEAEAPFRALIASALTTDTGVEPTEDDLDALVHWWKLGNKWHRPLTNVDQADEAKALRQLREEWRRRTNSGATEARDAAAVAALLAHDDTVMWVGRRSTGEYVAFAPEVRSITSKVAAAQNLWVAEHTTGKTAQTIKTRRWITPGARAGKMTTVFETETWKGWDKASGPNADLTDTEMLDAVDSVIDAAVAEGAAPDRIIGVTHKRKARKFYVHVDETDDYAEITYDSKPDNHRRAYLCEWKRGTDAIVFGQVWKHHRESYRTTRGDDGVTLMPWAADAHWKDDSDGALVHECPEAIAATRVRLVALGPALKQWRVLRDTVRKGIDAIEDYQREAIVVEARERFMRDYPDESLWADHRREMGHIRVPIDGDDWEYLKNFQGGKTPEKNLTALLVRLVQRGIDLPGLTVESGYRLLGLDVPEAFLPVADAPLHRVTEPR